MSISKPNNNLIEPLVSKNGSEKLLELTKYWVPPVEPWKPLFKKKTNLRMACVLEDRLHQGMQFECELMLLNPGNWQPVIKYAKPDVLLMESIWTSATGHWHLAQCPKASSDRAELLEILKMASKKSIPTVFWMTKGHEYHELYKEFATHFDYVFCADPIETDLMNKEGVKAETLLPCTQPVIFNPFRLFDEYNKFGLDILYDGWADMDRLSEKLSVLNRLKNMGLSIVESHYMIFKRRINTIQNFMDNILGCIDQQSRIMVLKYAKINITFNHSLSSNTTLQWDSMDAAASKLLSLNLGSLSNNDIRKGIVIDIPDEQQFVDTCEHFLKDTLSRQKKAHLAWRSVCQYHTFSHRIQTICNKLKIDHGWEEFPKVSLITPTFRKKMISRSVDTYKRQIYPSKELIIVYNGDSIKPPKLSEISNDDSIQICIVPKELFAGACLNTGYLEATGKYCFRIDDDDLYGDNYILDLMLYLRGIDANIFGKPPSGLFFKGENHAYIRPNQYVNCILSRENIQSGKIWIGGNTMASNRKAHLLNPYNDTCYGAVDSDYQLNSKEDFYALMDNFNVLAERRSDQSSHTWKINTDQVKKNDKIKIADLIF